jgi:hypothetical protein
VALASTAAIAVGAVVLYIAAGSGSGSTPSTRTEASVYAATVKENSADVRVIYAFTTGSRKFGATVACHDHGTTFQGFLPRAWVLARIL